MKMMMMTKSQLIDAIQQINPGARAEWLGVFGVPDLRVYLDHLQITLEPRGAASRWVRRGDTRAVVWR